MGYVSPGNLRAETTKKASNTTLQEALARTTDLIEYIRRAPEEKTHLNAFFLLDNDEPGEDPNLGNSVANCGTPACVAGHTCIRFAPVSMLLVGQDALTDTEKAFNRERRPASVAADLLCADRVDSEVIPDRSQNPVGVYYPGDWGAYESWLFSGSMNSELTDKEEALGRLRYHRSVLKRLIKEEASA
jgi:hypothetical protein